jgi:hypothetical protein
VSSTPRYHQDSNSQHKWWSTLFAHVVVNPTIIWSRSQQPYTIYKYPGIWLVDSRCIFTFRIKFVEFLILPGYFHKDFTFSPLCCGIFQNVFDLFTLASLNQPKKLGNLLLVWLLHVFHIGKREVFRCESETWYDNIK